MKFVPTNKGHNSKSILEMIPEGAETWKGKISKEITVNFEVEGIYGYKCQPHFPLGMVGIIQVGDDIGNFIPLKRPSYQARLKPAWPN